MSRPWGPEDFTAAIAAFRDPSAPPRGEAPAGPEHFLASARDDIERAAAETEDAASRAIHEATTKIEDAHTVIHGQEGHA